MAQPKDFVNRPVESLQTMLRFLWDNGPTVLPVIPNGSYNSNTYASVRSFQEANSLKPNGITDQLTWETIVDAYDNALPYQTTPITQPSWNSGQTVSFGQFNYHLYLVQAMLRALSDFIPALPSPTLTGILDDKTRQGLRVIQGAAAMDATGELNTATWNYLNALYRAIIGNGQK